MSDETFCFLVERGQPENQVPTVWLEDTASRSYLRQKHWTANAHSAARFPTREAAEAYIDEHLTHPIRGASARAVEHGFVPVPLSPAVVRETMERFLREQGWTQRDDGVWQRSDGMVAGMAGVGAAVDVALRRAEEGKG